MQRGFATLALGGAWVVGCSAVYAPGAPIDDAGTPPAPSDAAVSVEERDVPDASPPTPVVDGGADADAGERRLRVFVTTASYKGSDLGQPTGGAIAEADRLCNRAANDFGIAGTYMAWLNTFGSRARDRLTALGPWYDATRKQVVFTRNPTNNVPPLVGVPGPDGEQVPANAYAWTGSDGSGALMSHCSDWTNGTQTGRFGKPTSPATWASENEQPCGEFYARLYCFETSSN